MFRRPESGYEPAHKNRLTFGPGRRLSSMPLAAAFGQTEYSNPDGDAMFGSAIRVNPCRICRLNLVTGN
jgi:hypothetical protein